MFYILKKLLAASRQGPLNYRTLLKNISVTTDLFWYFYLLHFSLWQCGKCSILLFRNAASAAQISVEYCPPIKGTVAWDFYGYFLAFSYGSSILDRYFKYWCVPYQTFSEILRISEIDNWVRVSPIFLSSGLAVLRETLQRVSILLGDSANLREWLTTNSTVLWECSSTT